MWDMNTHKNLIMVIDKSHLNYWLTVEWSLSILWSKTELSETEMTISQLQHRMFPSTLNLGVEKQDKRETQPVSLMLG